MIDSLNFFKEYDFGKNRDKFNHILSLFNKKPVQVINKRNKEVYDRGNIKNLLVMINHNSLSVMGSICKFYYGNNQKTFVYWDFVDAVLKLEELLCMDLFDAKVNRIDLAENLIMKNIPESYYPLLLKGSFLKRREDDNGLYYRSTNRVICIYDKILEEKSKRNPIASHLDGKNVFRYEFRMKNHCEISKRLKIKNVTVADVIENYGLLIWYWRKSFNIIPKDMKLVIRSNDSFFTTKEFKNYLAAKGLESLGGYGTVVNMVHDAKSRNVFKKYPAQSSNIKTMLKVLVNKIGKNYTPDMLLELEDSLDESMADGIVDYWQ